MSSRRFPEFIAPLQPANLPVRRCTTSREKASHRVLILRLGAHGDILMGTPLLTALRDAWPDAHITWAVERKEAPSIDAHPLLDEILLWDTSYWKSMMRRGLFPLWTVRALRMRALVREKQYDTFISLQPEEWPLLTRYSGAQVRVGVFDTFRQFSNEAKTSPRTRYYTHPYVFEELPPHRTDQYLLPLRALGLPLPHDKRMTMGVTQEDENTARRLLSENGLEPGQPFAVLAPMTTWPSRCWPAERYAELGNALDADQVGVVVIGSGREKDAVEVVARGMKRRPIVAAGILAFREMAALIAQANLLVSGDTGPMHVAAAVGTPYLALFGPTPMVGRAPLSGRGVSLLHPVPCGPCDQKICPLPAPDTMRCMRLITVTEAHEAARHLLGPGRPWQTSAKVAVP